LSDKRRLCYRIDLSPIRIYEKDVEYISIVFGCG